MIGLYAKLISGGASLLIQILLVVGGVLLFLFLDPFGITLVKKKTLKDTPVQVESIRQFGELITAEYYGEVIASLGEVIDTITETQVDSFVEITEDLHEDFVVAINELAKVPDLNKMSEPYDTFRKNFTDMVRQKHYKSYSNFIFRKLMDRNYKRNQLDNELTKAQEKKLFRKLYKNSGGWRDALIEIETAEFSSVFRQKVERTVKRKYRKPRLAMIGRGWVKAGFDFEEFNEQNFRYDKEQKTIHFIGLEPKIISATINPWFLPEQGVEGFQFLVAQRKVRMKPEYVKLVKQRCLDKLLGQAHKKAILQRSKDNAETYLKSFFSLLLDDEVRNVTFHTDLLDYSLASLLADSIIRNEEIFFIDSVIHQYKTENRGQKGTLKKIDAFLKKLRAAKYLMLEKKIALTPKSIRLFEILNDRTIDRLDSSLFRNAFTASKSDTLWYSSVFIQKTTLSDSLIDTQIGLAQVIGGKDSSIRAEIDAKLFKLTDSLFQAKVDADSTWFITQFKKFILDPKIEVDTLHTVSDSLLRKQPERFFFNQ